VCVLIGSLEGGGSDFDSVYWNVQEREQQLRRRRRGKFP